MYICVTKKLQSSQPPRTQHAPATVTMPVFVGQTQIPEYDPPPAPPSAEEQTKAECDAYEERQRLKLEIPPPQWKSKYRPKTRPKYEYVSVTPHVATEVEKQEKVMYRSFTADEIQRCYQDFYDGEGRNLTREERLRQSEAFFYREIPKMLAPGEFLDGPGIRGRVGRNGINYIYPESDFRYGVRHHLSTDKFPQHSYRYNDDDNRVLQEFAEQGWELVNCCFINTKFFPYTTFYFKRELELIEDDEEDARRKMEGVNI